MALPLFHTDDKSLGLLQTQWASALNPVLACPPVQGLQLDNVVLASGDNTISHRLGRKLQGWIIVRRNSAASVYDKQATNSMPNLTLVLNSSGACTVSLWVY